MIQNSMSNHIVTNSPWPFMSSLKTFMLMSSLIFFMKKKQTFFMFMSFMLLNVSIYNWSADIEMESKEGEQTVQVTDGLKTALSCFIITELLFFFSWFWSFFHSSLSPVNELGCTWPPMGIEKINPFTIPTLNTFLLISSGISVTYAHNLFLSKQNMNFAMLITVFLGIFFTLNQLIEYYESTSNISDSIFGSCFFVTTGFHGMHVALGTIFLLFSSYMINKKENSELTHNLFFSFSIWYWHFVDVIWLFLMIFIYLWS